MSKVAICPGSFDPVTNGHVDIIRRAANIFDTVRATVFVNTTKEALFTQSERLDLLQEATVDIGGVVVDAYEGLLIDYVRQHGASAVIKGLRAVSDFEYEFQMAQMNKKLADDVETLFMMTRSRHAYLSSSIVKEVARFDGDISELVPAQVQAALRRKLGKGSA